MRRLLILLVAATIGLGLQVYSIGAERPVPVILDTDIGDDIDDTWALAMLLRSPWLDVKLISTTCHKAEARAKIIAKMLAVAGRSDIPIGLGPGRKGRTNQDGWTEDFSFEQFQGKIHEDGAGAIVDTIHQSEQPITVIAIGPLQTLSAALARDPTIATKAHFVGMHGSVYRGYKGRRKVDPEYNVKRDPDAARRVLLAPWLTTTITPLDTCGVVQLKDSRFATLKKSQDPLVVALLENYRVWEEKRKRKRRNIDQLSHSTILFDTVAVYLGYPGHKPAIRFEQLPVAVTDDGYTRIAEDGKKMAVATTWHDLEAFEDLLLDVLMGKKTTY